MAVVNPFKAFHYNTKTIRDLADVITPPYDVIPEGMDKTYRARSPYNFAHVDLPHSANETYEAADQRLKAWADKGIVTRDNVPNYYLYRQTFTVDGVTHMRDVLVGAVLLHEFADGVIRPHENTYGQAKADRLQQMRATNCQLSQIFGMVQDPDGFLESAYEPWEYRTPLLQAKADDGVEHVIWQIEGAKAKELGDFFKDKPIYIVDGHHRYESSVQFAKERGALGNPSDPAAYMMFAIANSYDPALIVFPTHRLVKSLPSAPPDRAKIAHDFRLTAMTLEELKRFVAQPQATPQFALFMEGSLFLYTPKNWNAEEGRLGKSVAKLSVAWSDLKLFKDHFGIDENNRKSHIAYEKDLNAAWGKRETAKAVVFHAPPAVEDIVHVADENRFMPQKSTYFYPKLSAGLIMRDLRA